VDFIRFCQKLNVMLPAGMEKIMIFFKKIENIEKIENMGYFRYISDFFDIDPIHI